MGSGELRTRFAPSPTGSLHVGGVRTALYNLLCAKQSGGTFILRIEDTDQLRSTEQAALGIVRDMRWLGLDWDEGPERDHPQYGPYYQSQRIELYQRYARQLVDQGHAYEAWETNEELGIERKAAEAAKRDFHYRRRPYTDADLARFSAEGRKPVLRAVSPHEPIVVHDEILGEVVADAGTVDDFVILKADGYPTYHFAVVIDDHLMNVNLVLRGTEHLMNTHKHMVLYRAFGWSPPKHGHLPVILSPLGGKMSKRERAKAARERVRETAKREGHSTTDFGWLAASTGLPVTDIANFMGKLTDAIPTAEAIAKVLNLTLPMIEVIDFQRAGYLPEALLNYLALIGWSAGDDREIISMPDLIGSFSLDRVNKTGAQFDADKLAWMNGEYMQSLPEGVLLHRLEQWLSVVNSPIAALDLTHRQRLIAMYRKRAKTFQDMARLSAFLFARPASYDPKKLKEHLDADGQARLREARAALAAATDWSATSLKAVLEAISAAAGMGIGKVVHPVRIALTGDGVGPEIDLSLAFLGQPETLARIDAALGASSAISG